MTGATLPVLATLVDKSLLSRSGEGRYVVHELARQYGAARLVELQEVAQTPDRHLAFFATLAETAEPRLRSGPQIVQWYNRIDAEHDNLRTALEWAFTDGEFEAGLRMVGALWEFWMNRGHAHEGYQQAERFLMRPEAAVPNHLRAKALHTAGRSPSIKGATKLLYLGVRQGEKRQNGLHCSLARRQHHLYCYLCKILCGWQHSIPCSKPTMSASSQRFAPT